MIPNTLSYSHLHLLACPYAAFLRYQAGIKAPSTPWLALGNALHLALEKGHDRDPFSLENAISIFQTEFQRILDEEEVFVSYPQMRKLDGDGITMLGGYYEQLRTGKIPPKPMALEEEFRIPFAGTTIVGRLDRKDINPDTGGLIVSDYKSGSTKPDPWFLRHDPQLTTYAWAVYNETKELPEKLVWWHLRTGERLETVRTLQDITDLETTIQNAIWMEDKGIRHRIFHTQICGQCEYSGMPRNGVRPSNAICDDHQLEMQVTERLGLR